MKLENIGKLPTKEWQDKYCYPWNTPKDRYETHYCNLICDCGKTPFITLNIDDEFIECICGQKYPLSDYLTNFN